MSQPVSLSRFSRREFVALAAVGTMSPAEWKHYPDPATELDVIFEDMIFLEPIEVDGTVE